MGLTEETRDEQAELKIERSTHMKSYIEILEVFRKAKEEGRDLSSIFPDDEDIFPIRDTGDRST